MNTVNIPKAKRFSTHGIALITLLAIVTLVSIGVMNSKDKEKAKADNPTFFFSESLSCAGAATAVTKPAGSVTLYLCVDGDNEGAGLFGSETYIIYPTAYVQINGISCGAFDTCINLSEEGTIKLLAASGPAGEGGNPVTNQTKLATINMTLSGSGPATLSFSTAQIINESQGVETRTGTGITITIGTSPNCGNGTINSGENCDGSNLDGATCASVMGSTYTGALSCNSGCTFNTSSCKTSAPVCDNDGTCDPGENTANCPADCPAVPASDCGDSAIDSGEECDGSNLNGKTCVGDGYAGGALSCAVDCELDYSACTGPAPGLCGNGAEEPGEECDDGNSTNGDGCSASCEIEKVAPPVPKVVPPVVVPPVVIPPVVIPPVVVPPVVVPPVVVPPAVTPPAPGMFPAAAPDAAGVGAAATAVVKTEEPLSIGLNIPTPDNDQCVQNFSNVTDSDGDGLSDRTECYIGTDSTKSDTDGDGCWDGDEINQFYTSPLNRGDCSVEAKTEEGVIITDPQPGWVIPKVRVAGITPKNTRYLSAVVFSSEYGKLSAVVEALNALTSASASEGIEMKLNDLESAVSALNSFINAYPDYEYGDLTTAADSLTKKITTVRETQDLPRTKYTNEKQQAVMNNFSESAGWIAANLMQDPISLGYTSTFSENAIGNTTAKGFKLEPDAILTDGKLYDVVAIATLEDGTTKSSGAVRFSVDSTLGANKPIPRSLGGENIPSGALALGNIFINGVRAEDGTEAELTITDQKPTISGDSQYGAQVYAVWESIVLASSVISDSEQGAFDIQAPKNLEANTAHKITLYAVKADEATGQNMRSENVDVYFRVNPTVFPWGIVFWGGGIALALALAFIVLKKRLRKKEAPAELAMEVEEAEKAYQAIAPKVQPTKVELVTPVTVEKTVAPTVITYEKPAEVYKPAEVTKPVEVAKPVQPAVTKAETKPVSNETPAKADTIKAKPSSASASTAEELNEYLENEVRKLKTKLLESDNEILGKTQEELEYEKSVLDMAKHELEADKEAFEKAKHELESDEEVLKQTESELENAEKKLKKTKEKMLAHKRL